MIHENEYVDLKKEKYKIIGVNNELLLITFNLNDDLNIFNKAIIITREGKKISPELPIGTLIKSGGWEEYTEKEME